DPRAPCLRNQDKCVRAGGGAKSSGEILPPTLLIFKAVTMGPSLQAPYAIFRLNALRHKAASGVLAVPYNRGCPTAKALRRDLCHAAATATGPGGTLGGRISKGHRADDGSGVQLQCPAPFDSHYFRRSYACAFEHEANGR